MKYKASKIVKQEIKRLKAEKVNGFEIVVKASEVMVRKKYFTERTAKNI